ncbi:MAG: hypothetical protein KAT62_03845, partial [Desulfuromonadales bacterium]|nr:hypothetical protein [Desulfuromonadales bacterium]
MPLITIIHDPADIARRDEFTVDAGVLLADWILEHYGDDGFLVPTMVFMGGISEDRMIDMDDFEAVNIPITGPVFILHRPLGVETLIYIAVAIVVAVAVTLLMPIPDLGGLGRGQKRSPNNALSGQTNIARLLDRVPEIFGQVRSYPDLIAPTVSEFINHVKFQSEYLCVGRGFFDLADFKSGDTLISAIPGSSATAYEPGTAPAEVLKTRQSNEVSGQELVAPNEVAQTLLDTTYTVTYAAGTDKATITDPAGLAWEGLSASDTINASELYAATGGTDYLLDGAYVIDTVSATQIVLLAAAAENGNWTNFNAITENVLLITGSTGLEPLIALPDQVSVRGPFVIPGSNNFEVWLDITAPKGLARGKELNKTLDVVLKFTFEEIDDLDAPTGPSFIKNITVSDKSRDPRFWTYKIGTADGLAEGQRYQVTGERLTESDPESGRRLEDVRWSRLAGIENITAPDTTRTTRVVIETQATQQVAALQERKFNVSATRKTVTWDGAQVLGNRWAGDGLVASRRMADAFLHYFLEEKLAARPLSALDV